MSKQHVDHEDLAGFARGRVYLPREKGEGHRQQARGLHEKPEKYLNGAGTAISGGQVMSDSGLLVQVLEGLHEKVVHDLESARVHCHSVSKGDASERVWRKLLKNYLPRRYKVVRGQVIDSCGEASEQIDVIVLDRQYTPFVFKHEGQVFVPAESVYAVFEVKQGINAAHVRVAQEKAASARRLHRTSLPIIHAGGIYPPKPPHRIYAGILAFGSEWKTPLSESPLRKVLFNCSDNDFLDLGCVAERGHFHADGSGGHVIFDSEKAVTKFLFKLIAVLQLSGTAPMIDIEKYAQGFEEQGELGSHSH